MEVLTHRESIQAVIDHARRELSSLPSRASQQEAEWYPDWLAATQRLAALDPNSATFEQVRAITGEATFSYDIPRCTECGSDSPWLLVVCDRGCDEGCALCPACVGKAAELTAAVLVTQ